MPPESLSAKPRLRLACPALRCYVPYVDDTPATLPDAESLEGVRNLQLLVEYLGSGFAGWQIQPDRRTVAGEVQRALGEILREPAHLVAASRTDAGVHALGQVASFTTRSDMSERRVRRGANALLPPDVSVRAVREVPHDFHARFSARGKHYRYRIFCRPARSPLAADRAWHQPVPLDLEAMDAAARVLVGEHDFAALVTRPDGERGTVRRLRAVRVRPGPVDTMQAAPAGATIDVDVVGDSFLYKMVRTLVGTLFEVGRGKRTVTEVAGLLRAGSRAQAGPTAPAHGLTLVRVFYDDHELAARAADLMEGTTHEHHGDGTRNERPGRAQGVRRAEGEQARALS